MNLKQETKRIERQSCARKKNDQKGKTPYFTEETGVTINKRSEPYYSYQRKSTGASTKVIPTMQLHCQLSQRLHQK
jgi:hypothetical protein